MFAEPSQTAKLKSILNHELGPLIAQQKSQLSVAVARTYLKIADCCRSDINVE
jgi:hypothetical protein